MHAIIECILLQPKQDGTIMKNANQLIGVIAGATVLIGAAWVNAQDWPQWRGVNRDGKVSGFSAPSTWPKELAQKWKTTVGLGDATPALVGDKLYVFARQGEEEVAQCLNAVDGKEIWHDNYKAIAVTGAPSAHPGPRSSPTVVDGKVITLGVGGVLSCLEAASGKIIWRNSNFNTTESPFYTALSPIVVDGLCIAHLGNNKNGTVLAFDLATGEQKWKLPNDCPSYASPVLMTVDGTKQIVLMTEKKIIGVSTAEGKLLWEIPFEAKGRSFNAATPIVDGQTVIFTGAGRGTKAVKIEKQGDTFAAKDELWSSPTATGFNTPVLKEGLLYGLSERGKLYCMNAKDGKEAWTAEPNLGRFGAIVDTGSILVALPEKSGLIVFKPSDKQYEEVAIIKVSDAPTYAHPVLAGKRIFVKDKDSVMLLTVE
jgi:outer membrane protein assembly factor BamB